MKGELMRKTKQKQAVPDVDGPAKIPSVLGCFREGIYDAGDFMTMIESLCVDVLDGSVDQPTAATIVRAQMAVLKLVDMQFKYGAKPGSDGGNPRLELRPRGKVNQKSPKQ